MYQPRWYREIHQSTLKTFSVQFRETDLWLGVDPSVYSDELAADCLLFAEDLYCQLQTYLSRDPGYQHSLIPYSPEESAPPIAKLMAEASAAANVGPMASVAGAFAQTIADRLEKDYPISNIIVENGGDIYLRTTATRHIAIWAGNSSLSNKLALEIQPDTSPLGICTSSGTVGPSLSFGKADAVTVLAKDAAVADSFATAIGNLVSVRSDIDKALEYSAAQSAIIGTVIILGDYIGFTGGIKLVKAAL
ncbi:MAG: ApbE family lipoprotein [Firmicutes bacterium]|nr:ApbE family lipoprotein [Bacillota bacterium]